MALRSLRWCVACVVVLAAVPVHAEYEFITNGTFEGGSAPAGLSGPLDTLADTIPVGWTRYETFSGGVAEAALVTPVANNGPSAGGVTAMQFQRLQGDNASGDWTALWQPLNINAANWPGLVLSMDVQVSQHNLVAGGWVAPAFEWPLVVQVNYLDVLNNPQVWRYGWYLANPGDSPPGPVNDPGSGLIPFYNDRQIPANQWVSQTFDLFNELPQVGTITRIYVGGSGHHYQGLADNVSLVAVPEPATVVLITMGLAALGVKLRRRAAV